MHEVSIAISIVDELMKIACENDASRVNAVQLRIGRMSGIVTDSLKFAFEALRLEHPIIASAEIVIDEIPLIYECNECNNKFESEDNFFPPCPECKSYSLKILSGEEQDIGKVELEV